MQGQNIEECIFKLVREVWIKKDNFSYGPDITLGNRFGSVFKGRISETIWTGTCYFSLQQNLIFEKYEGDLLEGVPHGKGRLYFRSQQSENPMYLSTWWDRGTLKSSVK